MKEFSAITRIYLPSPEMGKGGVFVAKRYHPVVTDPALVSALFNSTRYAWLWVILRLYIGYQWLTAGWHKVTGEGWVDGGTALKGFWTNAIRLPQAPAKPPITYDWYRDFLQFLLDHNTYTWFGKLIAYGELLVGICLIVGLFTGIAALGGALMNFSFMLAGAASTNPVLFLIAILLIMAWKVAGHWGLDRWALPRIGTPWPAQSADLPGQGGSRAG
jgi:thiosulfate dehydrogenase [quinone] large subunit